MGYKRETSTMISDFSLSSCCYIAGSLRMYRLAQHTWRHTFLAWFGMIGFSFIGFAAFLGFLRFGYFFPRRQHSIQDWHIYFSHLGSIVGMCGYVTSEEPSCIWGKIFKNGPSKICERQVLKNLK